MKAMLDEAVELRRERFVLPSSEIGSSELWNVGDEAGDRDGDTMTTRMRTLSALHESQR